MIAVRYYTRSGNTKKLAQAIAEAVSADSKDVSVALEEKVEILFLGCSYYAFDVDPAVKEFILNNKGSMTDERSVSVFITDSGEKLKERAVDIPAKVSGCIKLDANEAMKLYEILYKILKTE